MTSTHRRILIVVGAMVVVIVGAYVAMAFASGNTARPGTTVQGVDIGGMSRDEAIAEVEAALGPVAGKKVKVRALDQTFAFQPEAAGMTLDAAASVEPAFGRTWNPVTLVGNLLGTSELPAVVTVDQTLLDQQLAVISAAVDIAPTEPEVTVGADGSTVTPGTPGRAVDTAATAAAVRDALLKPRQPIDAVVLTVEPSVTPEMTDDAVALAEEANARPVTVQAGTVTAVIPGETVARALSFTAVDGELVPQLDGAVLHRAIASDLKPVEVKGRDATFKIKNGKPKVVKSKVGQGVSDEDLAAAVASVLDKPAAERTVTVTVGTREPKLTTEEAKALGVTERLSTFTQYFPYAAYRLQNIGQAARRVNGTVLKPGETFSMNDTIKERTKENGYTEGFVVGEGGVFAEALGGGVSTATTATWTAAFFAGMERIQTVAHSIYISRYKPGLEATVAWGIFDMKFRNPYSNAVFITASATGTSVTVSFWGTKVYDDITAEFGARKNIVPFEKIYDDSDTCLGQDGVDGFTITVDRVFWQDGKEVKREPITTRYKPAPDVTCGKDPKDKKKDKKGNGDTASPSPSPSASNGSKGNGGNNGAPGEEPTTEPGGDVFTNG